MVVRAAKYLNSDAKLFTLFHLVSCIFAASSLNMLQVQLGARHGISGATTIPRLRCQKFGRSRRPARALGKSGPRL